DGPADVLAAPGGIVGTLLHRATELRREDDPVAATLERAADVVLAHPLAVDVGRVEERDAGVERGVDDRERLVVIAAPPEVVRAEPDDRDLGATVSESPHLHGHDASRTAPYDDAYGASLRLPRRP